MGSKSKSSTSSTIDEAIVDTIRKKSDNGKSMELKLLRKATLVATNHITNEDDNIDKSMKKIFKSAVQSLENGELFDSSIDLLVIHDMV